MCIRDSIYTNTELIINYGLNSTSDTPTISISGGIFSLSENINNISINSLTGIVTFNNPIPVNTYNFNIIYTTNQITTIPYSLVVNPKNITCSGVNKTYDQTTSATVTLNGIINGDIVSSPTATFADKNVGSNKTVTITGSITGVDSGNYNLTTTSTTASITQLNICLLYTSPSPRDRTRSRMPSSA